MSEERLCEACLKLLSGQRTRSAINDELDIDSDPFWNCHSDAASFARALQLPCALCNLVWTDPMTKPLVQPAETEYQMTTRSDLVMYTNARIINFRCNGHLDFRAITLIPWQEYPDLLSGGEASYSYPELLSESTGSSSAIQFLSRKYEECCKEHVLCRVWQSDKEFYPTRLIDVGKVGDAYIWLRTRVSDGPYFCLSHRWGEKQPFMLTKETFPILEDGLLLAKLPKTFRDAVLVTRMFRIPYLWIDSLCIFQDDLSDWSTEASQMRLVYSHASCTIAATAASDGDGGLFFDRSPKNLRPLRLHATLSPQDPVSLLEPPTGLYWCDRINPWMDQIEDAPLNRRAWVVQERYLSRRTMHFTATQLFWECHKNRANENYPSRLPHWAKPQWFEDPMSLKKDLHDFQNQQSTMIRGYQQPASCISIAQMYHAWSIFRLYYSGCAMTKEEDKLVALQGIADEFGRTLGDELIAGLWKNRFMAELCWRNFAPRKSLKNLKSSKWRAPTWSWVSSNDAIWCSPALEHHWSCPQRHFLAELKEIDFKKKPSGELIHASIQVKCKLLSVTFDFPADLFKQPCQSFKGSMTLEDSKANLKCGTRGPFLDRIQLFFDDEGHKRTELEDQRPDFNHRMHMFVVQHCIHNEIYGADMAQGLLLSETSGSADVFSRVGIFTAETGKDLTKLLAEHERVETRVVTLV